MAKNREAALKRAREKARLDKREAKRERKAARQSADPEGSAVDEQTLWEQFARLSERHESHEISNQDYEAERRRILEALGIETGN